ncbi:MAG: thermonuclease family protein [Patescibacteria group bacterium]|nr:thermonuclease family protein [Patescibacteria group bacterium]
MRTRIVIAVVGLFVVVGLLSAWPPQPRPRIIVGYPQIIDGDTIKIKGQPIRLAGIDAEELSEPHGIEARKAMTAIIGGGLVTCEDTGERSHNRIVATCRTMIGTDIGQAIVAFGAALDCARYSAGRYRAYEPQGIRAHLRQKPYC